MPVKLYQNILFIQNISSFYFRAVVVGRRWPALNYNQPWEPSAADESIQESTPEPPAERVFPPLLESPLISPPASKMDDRLRKLESTVKTLVL